MFAVPSFVQLVSPQPAYDHKFHLHCPSVKAETLNRGLLATSEVMPSMHMRGRMEVLELSDGGILQGFGLLNFWV